MKDGVHLQDITCNLSHIDTYNSVQGDDATVFDLLILLLIKSTIFIFQIQGSLRYIVIILHPEVNLRVKMY